MNLSKKIQNAVSKFNLNLSGKKILTEAATGNFVVTPVIAALSGAEVFAFSKDSKYGSIEDVVKQTTILAEKLKVFKNITFIKDLNSDFKDIDVLTNTGFLRPINSNLLNKLSSKCVIPLMWEPWEYRNDELDLKSCMNNGIKVYGTNESDPRLKTKEYLGYISLYFLLNNKQSPFSSKILIIGNPDFAIPIASVLNQNNFEHKLITDYSNLIEIDLNEFSFIIVSEHVKNTLIIGHKNAIFNIDEINPDTVILHICGNVDFSESSFKYFPDKPAPFGFMSYTCDFIDNTAVVDLHAAGLKVAEGMLLANEMNLTGKNYKDFMEKNYPALAFENPLYW